MTNGNLMDRSAWIRAALAVVLLASAARGDEIRLLSGQVIENVTISSAGWKTVSYTSRSGVPPVRVNGSDVADVVRESRDRSLRLGEARLDAGSYEEALKHLRDAFKASDAWVQARARYLAGRASFEWAEVSGDKKGYEDAAGPLRELVEKFSDDWHVPEGACILGRALLAAGKRADAQALFKTLEDGAYTRRWRPAGQNGTGYVYLEEGKGFDAQKAFGLVARDPTAPQDLRREAIVGRARALLLQKDYDEVATYLKAEIVEGGPTRGAPVYDRFGAEATNLLGDAYRLKGGEENLFEALYYYLWTVVIFREVARPEYAEALARAAEISEKVRRPGQAKKLRARLKEDCPYSKWAKAK